MYIYCTLEGCTIYSRNKLAGAHSFGSLSEWESQLCRPSDRGEAFLLYSFSHLLLFFLHSFSRFYHRDLSLPCQSIKTYHYSWGWYERVESQQVWIDSRLWDQGAPRLIRLRRDEEKCCHVQRPTCPAGCHVRSDRSRWGKKNFPPTCGLKNLFKFFFLIYDFLFEMKHCKFR